jgi:PrtD family type I secretion system ABC transporter
MPLESIDVAKLMVVVHWLGMILGLGTAATADALGARMLLLARPGPHRRVLRLLHATIGIAILLVLFSGTGLIVLKADAWCDLPADVFRLGPLCVPNKLIVKTTLMTALIGVALLIETWLLPLAHRRERPLIVSMTQAEVARAATVVAASATCWIGMASIPFLKPLHSLTPQTLLGGIVVGWLALSIVSTVVLCWLQSRLRASQAGPSGMARHAADAESRAEVRRPLAHPATTPAPAPVAGPLPQTAAAPRAVVPSARTGTFDLPQVVSSGRPASAPVPAVFTADPVSELATAEGKRQRRRQHAAALPPEAAARSILRPALAGTFAISLVINILMLTGPLYMLQVYDRVLTSRSVETLVVLTILIVGLFATMGLLDLIRARILARTAIRLDGALAGPMLSGTVRVAPASAAAAPSPMRDLDQIRQFVAGPAPAAMLDLPWAPLYFGLVFLLHPVLGLVALVGASVLIALSIYNQVATRKPMAESAEATARCDSLVEAGRRGAETLRALGMTEAFRRRWLVEHNRSLGLQLRAGDSAGTSATATKVARMLLQSLLLGTGAWLALHDAVSPGAMIASSIIAGRALAPVEQIVAYWRSIGAVSGSVQRCRACLAAVPAQDTALDLPAPRGELAVTGLYVAPPGGTQPVLKGLGFTLAPGDAMAVIGPSAAGKSTLARALVGIWPARAGDIRLDGAALTQWDPAELGRHIGYLPQDTVLFDGNIAENIARLDPDPDPQAVIAAARAAGVHEMILRLDQGYATRVGEGGASLSGGQRQRIALARALYGNPALIVMDEPNANLDSTGEAALVEAIGRMRAQGRIVVVMAHRRSVISAVNRILALKEGRQTAFGPPEKLLSADRPRPSKEATNDNRTRLARIGPAGAGRAV